MTTLQGNKLANPNTELANIRNAPSRVPSTEEENHVYGYGHFQRMALLCSIVSPQPDAPHHVASCGPLVQAPRRVRRLVRGRVEEHEHSQGRGRTIQQLNPLRTADANTRGQQDRGQLRPLGLRQRGWRHHREGFQPRLRQEVAAPGAPVRVLTRRIGAPARHGLSGRQIWAQGSPR
ncbi:unnamed protein product, partial [Ixodes persulcatus]